MVVGNEAEFGIFKCVFGLLEQLETEVGEATTPILLG